METDREFRHALVIGGTGMLGDASIEIATRSREVTSVARTRRSLTDLDSSFPPGVTHHTLSLDWSDPEEFLRAVEHHLADAGPPDLVVAWLHDDELALRLTPLVGADRSACRFFHVIGSGAADPSAAATALREEVEPPPNVSYFQVILGFVRSGDRSRWLTNDEISAGVLEAVERERRQFVVGTIEPWSARP